MEEDSEAWDGEAGQLVAPGAGVMGGAGGGGKAVADVDASVDAATAAALEEGVRKGARIPESSASLVSEGVGDCCALQARVKAWKSNL